MLSNSYVGDEKENRVEIPTIFEEIFSLAPLPKVLPSSRSRGEGKATQGGQNTVGPSSLGQPWKEKA